MKAIVYVLITLAVAACGKAGERDTKDDLAAVSITHFTGATELFLEFEPLRAGEESAFAAHLTRLADWKPLTQGRVVVTLSGAGQADERFEAQTPAAAGIFKPAVKPRAAGTRRLTLALESGALNDVHDLGDVTVFPDAQAAAAAKSKSEDAGAIKFLMEQQWQVDFATAPAAARPLRATVAATGTIRGSASGSAQVLAPVPGQVLAAEGTFPHVGAKVRQGDALFRLVPKLAQDVDVATLRLAVERALLQFQHAERERQRLEDLFKQEAVSERRLLAARHDEDLARAELDAARKRLAPYAGGDKAGSGVLLRAPVAGTIVELSPAPGAFVNDGQVLAQIADPARLWLEARIPEVDAARLGQVSGAWVRAPGIERPLALEVGGNARLIAFGQAIDPATRTVPLILAFQAKETPLRIGTAVRAEIWSGASEQRLAVPSSALVEEGGQTVLFVQRGGESFERRVVSTGIRDGEQVEIRAGLQPGERIVTRGAYLVRLAGASPKAAGEGHVH